MTRLSVFCVLGLLLAVTSPGLTAPQGMPSQETMVPQPQQTALPEAVVTSGLANGSETSTSPGAGPSSSSPLGGSQDPLVEPSPSSASASTPSNLPIPEGGTSGSGLSGNGEPVRKVIESGPIGSGLTGSGLAGSGLAGSGLAGSGLTGSGLTGSGLTGSGLAGSGLAGSGLAGSGLAGSGLTGSGLTGSGPVGSGLGATAAPIPWLLNNQWQPGAGLRWLFEHLLGGGSGQGEQEGQIAAGSNQGTQGGLGPQGGQGPRGPNPQVLLGMLGQVIRMLMGSGRSSGVDQAGLRGLLSGLGGEGRLFGGEGGLLGGEGGPLGGLGEILG